MSEKMQNITCWWKSQLPMPAHLLKTSTAAWPPSPCGHLQSRAQLLASGNYSDGSPYHVSLYRLLMAIPMTVDHNGFFSGRFGAAGGEAFGLFMCYAGNTDAECQDCLDRAPYGIMKLCPHSQTVRSVYNSCSLQYSDESFFSVADISVVDMVDLSAAPQVQQTPYKTRNHRANDQTWYDRGVCVEYVVDTVGLSQTRLKLIHRLTVKANQAGLRIAEGREPFIDTQRVQAVVQCTRDLTPNECTRCLSYYRRFRRN